MSRWLFLAALLLAATGCGQAPPPAAPTPLLPTAVRAPTTAGGEVGAAASATPQPRGGAGLTAAAVLSAFRGAGLPIGEVTDFLAQPPRTPQNGDPGPYLTKVTWHDTRLPAPAHPVLIEVRDGGAVEVYADPDTAQTHADNIQSNAGLFSLPETDYVHGAVLVRLAHDLAPAALSAYKQVLDGLP